MIQLGFWPFGFGSGSILAFRGSVARAIHLSNYPSNSSVLLSRRPNASRENHSPHMFVVVVAFSLRVFNLYKTCYFTFFIW